VGSGGGVKRPHSDSRTPPLIMGLLMEIQSAGFAGQRLKLRIIYYLSLQGAGSSML
jgi:hypothetical protein